MVQVLAHSGLAGGNAALPGGISIGGWRGVLPGSLRGRGQISLET